MTAPRLSDAAASYADDVAAHLHPLPAARRRAALADLRDLLAEGTDPAELGSAEEYAAALLAALGDDAASDSAGGQPQGHVFGLPVESRGPTDSGVRSRIFDPSNPRILVPRLFGAGWTVNFGAVATRLGLLRPDDDDPEVLAHIPASVQRITRAVPVVVAAKTAVWVAVAWRTGEKVPSNWDLGGRVNRWSDRRTTLLPLLAIAGGAALWGTRPATSAEDQLVRRAIAASLGSTTAAIAFLTAWSASDPATRHPEVALAGIAPLAAAGAMLICPVRAGLRALAAEEAGS